MAIDSISRIANTGFSSTVNKPVAEVASSNEIAQNNTEAQVVSNMTTVTQTDSNSSKSNYNGESSQNKESRQPSMKDVSEINKVINKNTVAEFGYNEPTNRITIKIKDKETNEVIREIPSEKALEMLAKAWELAGLLVDEKR